MLSTVITYSKKVPTQKSMQFQTQTLTP